MKAQNQNAVVVLIAFALTALSACGSDYTPPTHVAPASPTHVTSTPSPTPAPTPPASSSNAPPVDKTPSVDVAAYDDCLKHRAEEAARIVFKSDRYGYASTDEFAKKVLAQCTAEFSGGRSLRPNDLETAKSLTSAAYKQLLEQQREQHDLKFEPEFKNTVQQYANCLVQHARVLALNSTEAAEVIVRAAFASCQRERQAIRDKAHEYLEDPLGLATVKAVDETYPDRLVLEIIAARASPPPSQPVPSAPPPAPPPARPGTPI